MSYQNQKLDAGAAAESFSDHQINLPMKEVIRRLRMRAEPIKFFGENELDTFLRLRKIELDQPLDDLDRQKNDFQQALTNAHDEQANADAGQDGAEKKKAKPIARYVWDEVSERVLTQLGKGDDVKDQKVIRHFWRCILALWDEALELRGVEEKRSDAGQQARALFKQTQLYIKPLFQHLKASTTPFELVPHLTAIVLQCQNGDYHKAIDTYEQMAIGNAAWPIGVTQVGIHSRGGREKIESNKVAHILNDENQRKYIHAMKRLMTYCQERFPSEPSRSFEFNAMEGTTIYPVSESSALISRAKSTSVVPE